jgi:hypothetical protein
MENERLVKLSSVHDAMSQVEAVMRRAEALGNIGEFDRLLDVKRCLRKRDEDEIVARKIAVWDRWRKEHKDGE